MRAKVLISILLLLGAGALGKAYAANFPLYVRYLAYTPPNLYLRAARATQAFYVPINSGTTFNFDLDPVVAGTLSLAEGPIPVTISAYRIPANCSGNKTVTVTIQYNIGGAFTLIGSETQVLNIPTTGPIVTSKLNVVPVLVWHCAVRPSACRIFTDIRERQVAMRAKVLISILLLLGAGVVAKRIGIRLHQS